jgi:hypothetical protein
MGDVATHSFEMLLAAQAQPVALLNGGNGKIVHFNSEMMSDLMATLRSR